MGAINQRNLVCNFYSNSTSDIVPTALASTMPHCVCSDTAAGAGEEVRVRLICGSDRTCELVAAGNIALGAPIYTASSGKVQALPSTAGTYWQIGFAVTAAAGNNSVLRAVLCVPRKIVVEAEL
jgi:hypothetical protein